MKFFYYSFLFSFIPIVSMGQEQKEYRSDTVSFSVVGRYLLISYGVGFEFPYKQNAATIQVGFNAMPNTHLDFNIMKVVSLEYKRYVPPSETRKQFYFGGYLLHKLTDHAGPHEGTYTGQWTKSKMIGVGPLCGMKWYKGQRIYLESFLGAHLGWQWGETRTDDFNSTPSVFYKEAQEFSYGIRFGFLVGFHPMIK